MSEKKRAIKVLTLNTLAFVVCFAIWMTNGVLITWLVDNQVFRFDKIQMGWLIGIPVLSGSLTRLPVGIWTDKYGGRGVFALLMLFSAIPMYLMSYANNFWDFFAAGLGFGVAGSSFAVGIAYTSVWFKKEHQGTALGIFGVGNAGAALTSLGLPHLLNYLTNNGANIEAWRWMPRIYAALLVITAIVFFLFTHAKKVEGKEGLSIKERLEPLKNIRVWRFGLYYFYVFGGFVALSQWLVPYYVSAYGVAIATAGFLAAIFSFPSGVIRALGGWMSDKYGARAVMYWVYGICIVSSAMLIVPQMEIHSPGPGIMAFRGGTVTEVTEKAIRVDDHRYNLRQAPATPLVQKEGVLVFPTSSFWQIPVVVVGQKVEKKELLAKGVTHIYFQANVWIFTFIVFVMGIMMGIGKAAVYRHIPDYFPNEVGVVGGIVGVVGGLGGFVCPIIFGYLLKWTGLWTTCWMFFLALTVISLIWMHIVIQRMWREKQPILSRQIDQKIISQK